jgi:uncharacterized protein YrrD
MRKKTSKPKKKTIDKTLTEKPKKGYIESERGQKQQIQQIQNVLDYFVAEGIAYEVSEGQYALTKEGRKMVEQNNKV